jgi:hypothetical protein
MGGRAADLRGPHFSAARLSVSAQGRGQQRKTGRRWLVVALRVAAVFGLGLGLATVRVIISGEKEIAASTQALERGDPREAAVRARRAAGWYAPGAPHVRVAYDRLQALARAAEERHRLDLALLAWRSVRSAAIETRWLMSPHRDELDRANREIARLSAGLPRAPDARAASEDRVVADQLNVLLRQEAPRLPWVVALVTGFVAWTLGLVWWARRVAGVAGQTQWSRAMWPALLVLLGAALWLLAAWRA